MTTNYYQKHKEKLQREAPEKYQNLSEEEKERKCKYHRECNKIFFEEQKETQVEYMRNYYLAHKK